MYLSQVLDVHNRTVNEGPHEGTKVQLYALFYVEALWEWVVKAMPRPLYPQVREPIPTVKETNLRE
jgi:hypothetical protein